ncbi:MAG: DUF262 domain-containing protein [Phocaeicola sp.]
MTEKIISVESPEIEPEDTSSGELITQPFSPSDIRLTTPPMNLGDIIDMIQYNYIDFDTEYQRSQNLWDDTQQSRLIESVLLGLRLPAFYFEEVSKREWRIIDGLQRCCAIRNFCVDESLELQDLEFLANFNTKRYDDFPFDIKRDVRMLPVTVNVLEKGVPDDVKYILFKRLNTGGITLTPQEIRNAVYIGKAINVVKSMAKEPSFLKATQETIPTLRKQDQDFISRFVAFYLNGYKNYSPDLDKFINDTMKGIKEGLFDENRIKEMRMQFVKAMNLAFEIFETDAFRKRDDKAAVRKPLNKAYFEVVSVGLAYMSDSEATRLLQNKELFKTNLITVMRENKPYNSAFSGGTGKRDTVIKRFSIFNDILTKSINGIKIDENDSKTSIKEL